MKRFGTAGGGILRTAAVIAALLLVPLAAAAQDTGAHAPQAVDCAKVAQDAGSAACGLDCMIPAAGHRLHCQFASPHPVAAGSNPPLDDDQPVTAAPAALPRAAQNLSKQSSSAMRIPVAVLPRFIVFGNYRS